MLAKLQMKLMEKGSTKSYGFWDKLGNGVQELRTFIDNKVVG